MNTGANTTSPDAQAYLQLGLTSSPRSHQPIQLKEPKEMVIHLCLSEQPMYDEAPKHPSTTEPQENRAVKYMTGIAKSIAMIPGQSSLVDKPVQDVQTSHLRLTQSTLHQTIHSLLFVRPCSVLSDTAL
jgi:hypothetical protein